MTYDFYVFPSELAEDLAGATEVYETAPARGSLTPDAPVAQFLAGLPAVLPAAGSAEPTDAHDSGVTVQTDWADPMGNLRAVASVAAPLDLSVLDLQLVALYDPRRRVDVVLDTEAGPQLPFVTRRVLREVVEHISGGRYHWVNLTRSGHGDGFAQSYRDPDGSWAVEHRDGEQHFLARTDDAELVEALLWSWARGDGRWQAMLAFSPVEL
jgi:hypothetical protein